MGKNAIAEVLQVSTVFNLKEDLQKHDDEELFLWTMRRMFRDMKIEIAQHINRPAEAAHSTVSTTE